jgi:hypothetical protein
VPEELEITMTDAKKNKCAHKLCSCIAPEGNKYCSAYCEAANKTTDIACGCEHPACTGSV